MTDTREKLKANALQLAAQLPADHDEAILVLGYLTELVEWGTGRDLSTTIPNPQRGSLVRFARPVGISPSRRANSNGNPSGLPK
jgi:hypothetical protein